MPPSKAGSPCWQNAVSVGSETLADEHGEIIIEGTQVTAGNVSTAARWQAARWAGLYAVNCRHYVAGEIDALSMCGITHFI